MQPCPKLLAEYIKWRAPSIFRNHPFHYWFSGNHRGRSFSAIPIDQLRCEVAFHSAPSPVPPNRVCLQKGQLWYAETVQILRSDGYRLSYRIIAVFHSNSRWRGILYRRRIIYEYSWYSPICLLFEEATSSRICFPTRDIYIYHSQSQPTAVFPSCFPPYRV